LDIAPGGAHHYRKIIVVGGGQDKKGLLLQEEQIMFMGMLSTRGRMQSIPFIFNSLTASGHIICASFFDKLRASSITF
jgi:hypothetical protein